MSMIFCFHISVTSTERFVCTNLMIAAILMDYTFTVYHSCSDKTVTLLHTLEDILECNFYNIQFSCRINFIVFCALVDNPECFVNL